MDFIKFKEYIYSYSKENGISDVYIYYTKNQSQGMSCLKGEVKDYGINLTDNCNVTLTINNKTTSISTNHFSKNEAKRIVKTAINICEFLEEQPQYLSFDECKIVNDNEFLLSTYEEISDIILKTEFYALNYSNKISSISNCSFKESITEVYVSNSNGLDKKRIFSNKFLYVSSVSNIKNRIYNGFDYSFSQSIDGIDYKKTAIKSSSNTLKCINPKTIKSKSYDVVLRNNVFCDLLKTFSDIFSAENAYKGLSLLKNKEGEKISSKLVSIVDAGKIKSSYFSCEFDDDGTNTREKTIVENGILNTLLYNNEWASKLNCMSTGNGFKASISSPSKISPCIFYLKKGKSTKKELFNFKENLIFITEINGLHSGANKNTGDFSLEATGFYVENGKISYPIEKFTISDNFYDILKKIELVGNDIYFDLPTINSQYGSPSVLVKNISIAN